MNRIHSPLPAFDPAQGTVVLSPEENAPGYWVGCPSVLHHDGRFWLTYRQRRPRGAVAPYSTNLVKRYKHP